MNKLRWLRWLGAGGALFLIASLVPGPYHEVLKTPSSSNGVLTGSHLDPETVQIVKRACLDCHSNATVWPVYSKLAPVSWMVRKDVSEGRKFMNLSLWEAYGAEGQAQLLTAARQNILDSSMPPKRFAMLHPDAKLSEADRAHLVAAFEAEAGRLSKEVPTQQ